jgi:pyruvate,water dikinase
LATANDIFFVHLDEWDAVASGQTDPKSAIASRKAEWHEQQALNAPMMIGLPIPFEMLGSANPMLRRMFGAVALQPATETMIHGVGASAGVVRGRARVVKSLTEADDLAHGDILVCPSTSPPWSPYFAVVAGVVTDAGGMISHAAIEAREYGIPAVVGTREATARIPDGATVTIDGTAGTITIER